MENIQYITLDLMNNKSFDYVYTKQYDVGRAVVFSITKDGEPVNLSGLSAIFSMTKPDGSVILYSSTDDEITINPNSTITLILTDQITVLSGKLPYQISLMDGTRVVSTITGIIYCEKAAVQMDDMRSVSDGSLIEDLAVVAQAIKDGEIHSGDIVNVSATLQSGVEIGEISVNDVPTKLYSPSDFSGNTHGLVPASDGATTKFLRSDGGWADPFTSTSQSIISADTASRWVKMYDNETNVRVSSLIVFECPQTPETPYTTANSQQVAIYTLPISTKVKKIKIALRTFAGYLPSQPDIVIGVKTTLDTVNPPSKLDEDWIATLYENRQTTDANLELNVNSESPYYLYIFGWAWNFEISSITLVENVVPTTIPEMSDVNISSLSEGQVLKYNSTTQKWVNANESGGGGGSSTLSGLSDVDAPQPADGDILVYDDSLNKWVSNTATACDLTNGYIEIYQDVVLQDGYWDANADEPQYTSLLGAVAALFDAVESGGGGGGGGGTATALDTGYVASDGDENIGVILKNSSDIIIDDSYWNPDGDTPFTGLRVFTCWVDAAIRDLQSGGGGGGSFPQSLDDLEDAVENGYLTFSYGGINVNGGAGATNIDYSYNDILFNSGGHWLDDGTTTYDSVKDSFDRIQTEIDDINTELTNMSSSITTTSISLGRDVTNTGYYWDGTHDSLLEAIQSLTQRVTSLEAIVNP